MKSIRVTGKGLIKVHPDMPRILIALEGQYRDSCVGDFCLNRVPISCII